MINKCKIAFYSPVPGSGSTLMSKGYAGYLAANEPDLVHLVSCEFHYSAFEDDTDSSSSLQGPVTVFLPHLDRNKCILCKACAKECVFGAIRIDKALSYITLKTDRCRACGACLNTCRYDAIDERERVIGVWKKFILAEHLTYYEGHLLAEDFFAIKLLQQVKKLPPEKGYTIIDAHGGLNYPAMESLHDSDIVVMVIDPSTFNTKYYQHVVKILRNYCHSMVGLINYSDNDSLEIFDFLDKNNIEALQGFPDLGLIKNNGFSGQDLFEFGKYTSVMRALHDNIVKQIIIATE